MNHFSKKNKVFTLIELLVVISIISLLISILLPALGAARKTAQRLQCTINFRTIGMGMIMYIDANKGYFVPSYAPIGSLEGHNGNGILLLRPYYSQGRNGQFYWDSGWINNLPSEACPSDQMKATTVNHMGHTYVSHTSGNERFRSDFYLAPSKSPQMMDSDCYYKNTVSDANYGPLVWWTLYFQYFRHGDTENVWFLDGHVSTEPSGSKYLNKDWLWALHSNGYNN